jgi:ubiquinone/menaquinone biosynthesis C-methylase UbiE
MSGEHGGQPFDSAKWKRLESEERLAKMPPSALAEAMALQGSETVVDVGCGTGFFAEPIARRCNHYIGVDHSAEMLDVFRKKSFISVLGNISLERAKADRLPIGTDVCDIAFHVALLHEIPDLVAFHDELKRVLKPQGRLYAVDWKANETEGGPPLDHRVSRERAVELLERDGFEIVDQPDIYADQYVIVAKPRS